MLPARGQLRKIFNYNKTTVMSAFMICVVVLAVGSLKMVQTKLIIQKLFDRHNRHSGLKEYCADKICGKITTLNITLANIIKYKPFLFITAVPKTEKSSTIDNICYTYINIGSGKNLVVQSVVDTYGGSKQFTFIEEDVAEQAGVVQGGDFSCSYKDHGLEYCCDGNLIVYRLYECGTCSEIDVPMTTGSLGLFAIGSSPIVSPKCQEQLVHSLKRAANSTDAEFSLLPYKMPTQCVLSINGMKAVGFDQAQSSGLGFIDI